MSTAQFTTPLITVIPGQLITASLWNNEYDNLFTNLNPLGIGAYSDTDPEMQTSTDPFPSGTSRPTSLGGELERIRYILNLIIGKTYWYQHPSTDLETVDTDVTALQARFPIQTTDIGNLQVTDAKINDVAFGKITGTVTPSDGTVTTAKIVDSNVTDAKIAGMAASKITGQIAPSQLDSTVPGAVGLKSIQFITATNIFVALATTTGFSDTTISSVNTAKTVVAVASLTFASDPSTSHNIPMVTVALTSATNLRVTLNIGSAPAGSGITYGVKVVILEFN